MKNYRRSDLACEALEGSESIDGIESYECKDGDLVISTIRIVSEVAATALEKKLGTYVTVSTPELWKIDDEQLCKYAITVGREIRKILCNAANIKDVSQNTSILIVGLGNELITADAIGPQTLSRIDVTRHIKILDPSLFSLLDHCQISAIAPGVLGRTGIESADIVRAACEEVVPDAIIVIDALAAGAIERLACTVQISDGGINPGAGIGNLRSELSPDALGRPVIAIGVPTVVDTSAVVYDALCRSGTDKDIPEALKAHLDNAERFYVTPKESDLITEKIAVLLSESISEALRIKND